MTNEDTTSKEAAASFDEDKIQIPAIPARPDQTAKHAVQPNTEAEKRKNFEDHVLLLRKYIAGLKKVRERIRKGEDTEITEVGQVDFIKQQLAFAAAARDVYQQECDRIQDEFKKMQDRRAAAQFNLDELRKQILDAEKELHTAEARVLPPNPAMGAAPAPPNPPPATPPCTLANSGATTGTPPTGTTTSQPTASFPTAPPLTYSSATRITGIHQFGGYAAGPTPPPYGQGHMAAHGLPPPSQMGGTPAPVITTPLPSQGPNLGPFGPGLPQAAAPYMQTQYLPINSNMEDLKAADKLRAAIGEYRHTNDPDWVMFMDRFWSGLRSYHISTEQAKLTLYMSLRGNAYQLACPFMNPSLFPHDNTYQYAARLEEMFQPQGEIGQLKMAFEARVQRPGEHALTYYQQKINLFLRAYPAHAHDYEMFYTKVVSGMTNQHMRQYLRVRYPQPRQNIYSFRSEISLAATMVRRMLEDGEISEREAAGAEMYDSIPEGGQPNSGPSSKIHHLGGDNQPSSKTCYHCGSADHFIAQCSRKASGLPPVNQAVQPQTTKVGVVKTQQANGGRGRGGKTRGATRGRGRGRGGKSTQSRLYKFRRTDGRISLIQEDENGVLCETHTEEPMTPASGGVNQVGEEVEAFANEYANSPFLGTTH